MGKPWIHAFCLLASLAGCTRAVPPSPRQEGGPPVKEVALEEKIGRMLLFGLSSGVKPEDESVKDALERIKQRHLGAVILYGHNIEGPEQLRTLTTALHAQSPTLLIAVDQEGGKVQRLTPAKGFEGAPSAEAMVMQGLENARRVYRQQAQQLAAYGIHLNFAPVVDVNPTESLCPVIGALGRSYGSDPNTVVAYATVFVETHRQQGVLTSLKHFPGHGAVRIDTHVDLADVAGVSQAHQENEWQVVDTMMRANLVDSIMVGHLMHTQYDAKYPATLSPVIVKKLLRDKGYDGVVVTDDLHMGAIVKHFSLREVVLAALRADCDLLMWSNHPKLVAKPTSPAEVISIVKQAIATGELSEARIDTSYRRILRMLHRRRQQRTYGNGGTLASMARGARPASLPPAAE